MARNKVRTRDWRTIATYLRRRESFKTHGALRGYRNFGDDLPLGLSVGILPRDWVQVFRDQSIQYVVYSYATPIAWLTSGVWIIPDVKYSRTTSKHQSTIRTAVHVIEDVWHE